MALFLFLLNSYHFIVIVETEEPLEIFPICLKHSELEDDKCAILIDFFGAYFWSSGCSQFRQRATKGRHMATKGAMMGSSGIIMGDASLGRGAGAGLGRHGRQRVKTRTSLSLQTRLNI